jgi:hypothetical protein
MAGLYVLALLSQVFAQQNGFVRNKKGQQSRPLMQ